MQITTLIYMATILPPFNEYRPPTHTHTQCRGYSRVRQEAWGVLRAGTLGAITDSSQVQEGQALPQPGAKQQVTSGGGGGREKKERGAPRRPRSTLTATSGGRSSPSFRQDPSVCRGGRRAGRSGVAAPPVPGRGPRQPRGPHRPHGVRRAGVTSERTPARDAGSDDLFHTMKHRSPFLPPGTSGSHTGRTS